jgi:hypothetical protein
LAEVRARLWLALAACAGAALLVVAAAGLLPAREPDAAEREAFSVNKTTPPPSPLTQATREASRAPLPSAPDKAVKQRPPLVLVSLCEAPERGARWYKLELSPTQTALMVWCKEGYQLFGLRLGGAPTQGALPPHERVPEVTRLARFKTRADLPGGAVAGDFDADGQLDLALGVAARPGVVHRSGAGLFWVRGRAQGGLEPARVLAETSSAALAAYEIPGAGHELVMLSAGDVAAQRPGELWSFKQKPSLSRQAVAAVGLDPRGVALRPGSEAGLIEAWALSGQPGRLDRLVLELASHDFKPEHSASLAWRGAQALAHEPSEQGALLARDATSIQHVGRSSPPALVAFAADAQVGPFAVSDLDGDMKLDVLSALNDGVGWLAGDVPLSEYTLPAELKVEDVETARAGALGAPLPLALVQGAAARTLSLLVLPNPPWTGADVGPVELLPTPSKDAQLLANVALE